MGVDPVDGGLDDLILSGLVEDLMHEAMPLDDLLVLRGDGVVPVDIEVAGHQAVVLAMHDQGWSLEIVGIHDVVSLGDTHLLDESETHVMVVQRVAVPVVEADRRIGTQAVWRVAGQNDVSRQRTRRHPNRLGIFDEVLHQASVEAGQLGHREKLADLGQGVTSKEIEIVGG